MTYEIAFTPTSIALPPLSEINDSAEVNERLIIKAYAMVAEAERLIAAQRNRIKTLESLSFTDELTGLTNRRGFELAVKREVAAAQRDPACAGTVIMMDLDGFKQVNDHFGHAAGDAYLKAVADVLTGTLRGGDCIARLGGDEFAVLLPHARTSQGQRRAAQLQLQLNAACLNWQGLSLPLRVSLGAAPYNIGDTVEETMKRADARLYSNKAQRKAKRAVG